MKNHFVQAGFLALLVVSVSLPLPAQRGERGARGANSDGQTDDKRKAIQAQKTMALARENVEFKRTMDKINNEQKASTSDSERDLLKVRAATARRDHQAAIQKINADAQAALRGSQQ